MFLPFLRGWSRRGPLWQPDSYRRIISENKPIVKSRPVALAVPATLLLLCADMTGQAFDEAFERVKNLAARLVGPGDVIFGGAGGGYGLIAGGPAGGVAGTAAGYGIRKALGSTAVKTRAAQILSRTGRLPLPKAATVGRVGQGAEVLERPKSLQEQMLEFHRKTAGY